MAFKRLTKPLYTDLHYQHFFCWITNKEIEGLFPLRGSGAIAHLQTNQFSVNNYDGAIFNNTIGGQQRSIYLNECMLHFAWCNCIPLFCGLCYQIQAQLQLWAPFHFS